MGYGLIIQVLGSFFAHVYSAVCSAGIEMHAKKILVGRRNTPTFKHYERLGIKRILEIKVT